MATMGGGGLSTKSNVQGMSSSNRLFSAANDQRKIGMFSTKNISSNDTTKFGSFDNFK